MRDAQDGLLAAYANDLVIGIARRWLALSNTLWAIYLLLPFGAPVAMQLGWTGPAEILYAIYSMLCHQLPDHSYFLFGSNPVPLITDLEANGMGEGLDLLQRRQFIGNPELGYKTAICQRDLAIYGAVLAAGLLYALVRPKGNKGMRQLPLWLFLIFLIPIGVDGLTQLVGLRESNWELRTLTGALFGAAAVWFAYPYVDDAMQEVLAAPPQR